MNSIRKQWKGGEGKKNEWIDVEIDCDPLFNRIMQQFNWKHDEYSILFFRFYMKNKISNVRLTLIVSMCLFQCPFRSLWLETKSIFSFSNKIISLFGDTSNWKQNHCAVPFHWKQRTKHKNEIFNIHLTLDGWLEANFSIDKAINDDVFLRHFSVFHFYYQFRQLPHQNMRSRPLFVIIFSSSVKNRALPFVCRLK